MEADFLTKNRELADFHKVYEPVANIIEPFSNRLKELKLTPHDIIQNYIDIERRLAAGQGVAVIKGLVAAYRIPVADLIEALSRKSNDGQLNSLSDPGQRQPISWEGASRADLRQKADQAAEFETTPKRDFARAVQIPAADLMRDIESDIKHFRSARDSAGNALHSHYDKVEADMAAIALACRAQGQLIPPLRELYERAVWTNPYTRRTFVPTRRRSGEARHEGARAKSPGNVAKAPMAGSALGAGSVDRSLRDEILAHLDSA